MLSQTSLLWRRALPPLRTARRAYAGFHDPIDHVTGLEKRELLAHLAGDCDPFRMLCIKKGTGTRNKPNLIPSAFDKRLVGCLCEPNVMHPNWMWLHQCEPKRCECGWWFELCPVAPFVVNY